MQAGELFITGRIKDLIIVRGINHYPQDIERTVQAAHPALRANCGAAFSVADERGEETLVIVQEIERTERNRIDPAEMKGLIRENVTDQHELFARHIVLIRPGTLAEDHQRQDPAQSGAQAVARTAVRGSCGRRGLIRNRSWQRRRALCSRRSPLTILDAMDRAIVNEVGKVRSIAGQRILDAIIDEIAVRAAGHDPLQRRSCMPPAPLPRPCRACATFVV